MSTLPYAAARSSLVFDMRKASPFNSFIRNRYLLASVACVTGGIVRVRGKILTVKSEYGWRSREGNGKEPL